MTDQRRTRHVATLLIAAPVATVALLAGSGVALADIPLFGTDPGPGKVCYKDPGRGTVCEPIKPITKKQ